jgi:hypothetical protein
VSNVWPGRRDFAAYLPPVKEQPPQAEHRLIDDVASQRTEAGLPVDPESVRRAIQNSERRGYPLPGLFYTPEEEYESETVDHQLAAFAEALAIDAGAEVGQVAWCWRNGKRAVEVSVKNDVERYRRLLTASLGSDRVIVKSAHYSERELGELCERIGEDMAELGELGIQLAIWGPSEDSVEVAYFAVDRERAGRLLIERYGAAIVPKWLGPSSVAEQPQPFGSFVSEGTQLTVFYPLSHNGVQPGNCVAQELPDRVIVSLTVLVPHGAQTLVGGFKPADATVQLAEPLGQRTVIDAAHDLPRPQWTGRPH